MFYHALTRNGGATPTEDLEPVLLWENSNPTVAFSAQTVSLDLTDYSGVIVEFNKADTSQILTTRVYAKKTDDFSIFGCGYIADIDIARNILEVNNTGVKFGAVNTGTAVCIPSKIYGVKEYVVEPNYSKFTISISNDAGSNTIEQNIFKSAKVINTSSGDSTRDIILSDTNGNTVTVAKGETKVVDINNFEKLSWSTTRSVFVNGTIELTLKGSN